MVPFRLAWFFLLFSQLATATANAQQVNVMTFNILEGGGGAAHVGFSNKPRHNNLAEIIRHCKADIVGIQECGNIKPLLKELGKDWNGIATGKSVYTGGIASRWPIEVLLEQDYLQVVRVKTPGLPLVVVNAHWAPPKNSGAGLIQKKLRENSIPKDLAQFELEILKASDASMGPRGYLRTIETLAPFIKAGENVILTGDFNESSHLDWTPRYARNGSDRWVKNPTNQPLRSKIAWKGSQLLAEAGMRDAYRMHFPDEVEKPGITWTPPYPPKTPGRKTYDDQILERIDMIYYFGKRLQLLSASVVGEDKAKCEIAMAGPWPSDHRAVVATFEVEQEKSTPSKGAKSKTVDGPIRVACVGDSITQGARVDAKNESYPARLAEKLGTKYEVKNFGKGGATLIKVGTPNIWGTLNGVKKYEPDVVVISLGTNDTVSGKHWKNNARFESDYSELIDSLTKFPTKPWIVLCTPTSMVLETKGLSPSRFANLKERKPRLDELCERIRKIAEKHREDRVSLLELNIILDKHPEWLTEGDGVHPNAAGYSAIADAVAKHLLEKKN